MKLTQITKILLTIIIATALMFFFDLLFSFPIITDAITNWIVSLGNAKWLMWLGIWVIMFVQVCLIPIPAVVVIQAAMSIGIIQPQLGLIRMFGTWDLWLFVIITMTAYMAGAVVAYFMGYKWGTKAVKWCAGEDADYDKWCKILTEKGKWYYAGTVLLPVFPDDLLCLVCGSVKFNFNFFFWANLFGRTIGLICMLGTLAIVNSGNGHISTIAWGVALVLEIVTYIILKIREKRQNTDNKTVEK